MNNLPIAKTELRKIKEGGCLYADKTRFIAELVWDNHKYYFLSRPRRFGKSLLLDTMRAAFAGERELFAGLFLEGNWDWEARHPVVKVSLGGGGVKDAEELRARLGELLADNAERFGVELDRQSVPGRFQKLLFDLKVKYKRNVVVLVDDCDKPLMDNIGRPGAEAIRDVLVSFYSVLKNSSAHLQFVFLTGASKFKSVSDFNGLNNLTDISLVPKYADICGITQAELETVFAEHLAGVDLARLEAWYGGYRFGGSGLYNPNGLLKFLEEKVFKPYWPTSDLPTSLLEQVREQRYFLPNLEALSIERQELGEFDLDRVDLSALLFQTGYLTIKGEREVGERLYFDLRIPNKEVRMGLGGFLLRRLYADESPGNARSALDEAIYRAVSEGRPGDLEPAFRAFFAGIPHAWYVRNDIARFEGFYTSMFYAFFAAQGFAIVPEDFTNRGRIDMTVLAPSGVFLFEFKMAGAGQDALGQVRARGYAQKYQGQGRPVFLVGVEFDPGQRNISAFAWEAA